MSGSETFTTVVSSTYHEDDDITADRHYPRVDHPANRGRRRSQGVRAGARGAHLEASEDRGEQPKTSPSPAFDHEVVEVEISDSRRSAAGCGRTLPVGFLDRRSTSARAQAGPEAPPTLLGRRVAGAWRTSTATRTCHRGQRDDAPTGTRPPPRQPPSRAATSSSPPRRSRRTAISLKPPYQRARPMRRAHGSTCSSSFPARSGAIRASCAMRSTRALFEKLVAEARSETLRSQLHCRCSRATVTTREWLAFIG